MFELKVEDSFNAAHQLREYEGPCENLHGHTWKVVIYLSGEKLGPIGMGVDFKIVKKKLNECLKTLDHTNLNDLNDFKEINPTSENVAKWVFYKMKNNFNNSFKLFKVEVFESERTSASYYE